MTMSRKYVRLFCWYIPGVLFMLTLLGLQLSLLSSTRRQQQRLMAMIMDDIPGPSITPNTNATLTSEPSHNTSALVIGRMPTHSDTSAGTTQDFNTKIVENNATENHEFREIVSTRLDVSINVSDALMYGIPRNRRVFLAIGIPSISRNETFYLEQTIGSLIDQSTEEQRNDLILVIFLADFDSDRREEIALNLTRKFNATIQNGFLQIIKARRDFYPTLDNLKQNFKDEMTRVKWRSKQNYDYAYLMKYSSPLAEFYMQLEDDIIAASNYLKAIKLFIQNQNSQKLPWVCLEFSRLGFIGKLFHSEDAEKLAKMLMLFYDEQPVDLLLPFFRVIKLQRKPIHFPAVSLFQHMGTKSSLENHNNTLKDKFFQEFAPDELVEEGVKSSMFLSASNPRAKLETSLKVYEDNALSKAYQNITGVFWGRHVREGDFILIKFNEMQMLQRVVIETCKLTPKEDCIEHGVLEVAEAVPQTDAIDNNERCLADYVEISQFVNGRVDAIFKSPLLVDCVRIRITADQVSWIVIREIAIFA